MKRLFVSPWVLAAPALVFFFWLIWRWNFIVDDAYISFRYARHLLDGHGLVYNPAQPPVEGYTNLLWTLLMALGPVLNLSFETWSRITGIICTLLLVPAGTSLYYCLSRQSEEPVDSRTIILWSGSVAVLLLLHPAVILWAGAGLEAPLFALLLSGGALAMVRWLEGKRRFSLISGMICFALLILCRPEGLLFALFAAVWVIYKSRQSGRLYWGSWAPLVLFMLVAAGLTIWRMVMYGDILPNTFYAKVGSRPEQLIRGLEYVWKYLTGMGGVARVILVFLGWRAFHGSPGRGFIFALAALVLMSVIAVGGDSLPMYRFMVPLVPLEIVLIAGGIRDITRLGMSHRAFPALSAWAVLLILAGSQAAAVFHGRQALYVEADRERMQDRIAIGKWLKQHYPGRTIALNAAGAIPFYSGLRAIDMLGLNEPAIARATSDQLGKGWAGHEKHDAEYVLSRRPAIIFIGRNELTLDKYEVYVWLPGDQRLLRSETLKKNYRTVSIPVGYEYFTFYLRQDQPLPQESNFE